MKTTNSRKVAIAFGGILVATLAAGCFGGGGRGYSNNGYNSSYSSYGDSYPYRSYGNSYGAGYQNGVRADENRDRRQDRDIETRVDHDRYSSKDSESGHRTEKN